MSSKRLSPQDLLFIYGETSSSKMHVAGLLPFTPPADAPRDYLRRMIDEARRQEVVAPWNRKLAHPRLQFSPLHSWVEDVDFDFDYLFDRNLFLDYLNLLNLNNLRLAGCQDRQRRCRAEATANYLITI